MTHEIVTALQTYLREVGQSLAHFVPRLLTALLMLLAGLLIAVAVRGVTRLVFRWLHLNALMERIGAGELLQRAGLGEPDRFAGRIAFWVTWIFLLFAALRALGVHAAETLERDFVHYIPRLVSAVVILVLGVFLSNFAWRASLLAAVNARVPAAKLIGALVRAVTVIAATAMALEQLEIGQQVVLTAFAISFGAVMLALSIAFGLGGRDLARHYLEQRLQVNADEQEPKDPGPSHL